MARQRWNDHGNKHSQRTELLAMVLTQVAAMPRQEDAGPWNSPDWPILGHSINFGSSHFDSNRRGSNIFGSSKFGSSRLPPHISDNCLATRAETPKTHRCIGCARGGKGNGERCAQGASLALAARCEGSLRQGSPPGLSPPKLSPPGQTKRAGKRSDRGSVGPLRRQKRQAPPRRGLGPALCLEPGGAGGHPRETWETRCAQGARENAQNCLDKICGAFLDPKWTNTRDRRGNVVPCV